VQEIGEGTGASSPRRTSTLSFSVTPVPQQAYSERRVRFSCRLNLTPTNPFASCTDAADMSRCTSTLYACCSEGIYLRTATDNLVADVIRDIAAFLFDTDYECLPVTATTDG